MSFHLNIRLLLSALLFLLAFPSCVSKKDGDAFRIRIDRLEQRIGDLEGKKLQSRLLEADRKIKEVTKLIENLRNLLPESHADLTTEIEQLKRSIESLTGNYEEAQFRTDQAKTLLDQVNERLEELSKRLESPELLAEYNAEKAFSVFNWPSKIEPAYQAALNYEANGLNKVALKIYSELNKKFPTNQKNKKWLHLAELRKADLLLEAKKFNAALLSYRKLLKVEDFAGLRAEFLFKMANILFIKGDYPKAKIFFQQCSSEYKKLEYGKSCADWMVFFKKMEELKKPKRKKSKKTKRKKKR